jgi:hypothetical protein
VQELYEFARGRLHSNYIFWEYVQEDWYRAWDKVLAMFRSSTIPATPTGGLAAACPRQYARCVTGAR